MKKKTRTVIDILENPPTKEVDCPRCAGGGTINHRGMHTSDKCPDCYSAGEYYYKGTGKIEVQDNKKTEQLIRKAIKDEASETSGA